MSRDTETRLEIAALVYLMASAVLFGAGIVAVLTVPQLDAHAGIAIAAVVVLSLVLAAPIAWFIAPRLRARCWRQQPPAALPRF
jgi:hypothetical protein